MILRAILVTTGASRVKKSFHDSEGLQELYILLPEQYTAEEGQLLPTQPDEAVLASLVSGNYFRT